jgi:hypothetical protein
MNTLTKWNPFRKPAAVWDPWREFAELENRIASAFGGLPARTNGAKKRKSQTESS